MIRGRELYGIIEQAVDREEVDGAIVVTTKGSILTTAGFEEPKVVSAISANIWSHFRVVGDLGDLETVVFDAEQGVLAVGGLPEYLVGLYSKKRAQPGLLLARLEALRSQLVAYTSLTRSINDDDGGAGSSSKSTAANNATSSAATSNNNDEKDDDDDDDDETAAGGATWLAGGDAPPPPEKDASR